MARPSVNNAEYFTHHANLRNDRRIRAIRSELGAAGYGVLIMLLEVLTEADFTELNTDPIEIKLLAGDLGVSVTEIDSLLQLAEEIGYFGRNSSGNLICPGVKTGCFKQQTAPRLHSMNFKRWKDTRAFIFGRDNYTCTYCGQKGYHLEVDHIRPLSRGGSNDHNNLTTACRKCNRSKGAKPVSEFLKTLPS